MAVRVNRLKQVRRRAVWSTSMPVELGKDEMFSSAVAGLPKVAKLIAACHFEDRRRAFEAAQQSYLETARGLGYGEADALEWAEAVMFQLRRRIHRTVLRFT